jgi:hypothetical protein
MTPRIFGAPLAPESYVVRFAHAIFDASRGLSSAPSLKRDTRLTPSGSVGYRYGRGGPEWSGNGSNAYITTSSAFNPVFSPGVAMLGCVITRNGTKTTSSGNEEYVCLGDAVNNGASGGVFVQIGLDDSQLTGTAGKVFCRARFQNGGSSTTIAGPAVKTDGTPMALAAYVRRDSGSAFNIDFYVDGVLYTVASGTTATTENVGHFTIGVMKRATTVDGNYITSASAVLLAFYGVAEDSRKAQEGLSLWTEDPYSIFKRPDKRVYYLPVGDSPSNASLTASLALDATITGFVGDKTCTVTLKSYGGDPLSNATGLKWAWWDFVTPNLITAAPTDKGSAGATDANGVLQLSIPNSTKTSGQPGWLVVTDSDGTVTQSPAHKAFSGPVEVD